MIDVSCLETQKIKVIKKRVIKKIVIEEKVSPLNQLKALWDRYSISKCSHLRGDDLPKP
jgi:hypothetical protein